MAVVLVVEDRAIDRKYLAKLLELAGHTVIEAADGVEALQLATGAAPDLVISERGQVHARRRPRQGARPRPRPGALPPGGRGHRHRHPQRTFFAVLPRRAAPVQGRPEDGTR